jgi:hypothetical protein
MILKSNLELILSWMQREKYLWLAHDLSQVFFHVAARGDSHGAPVQGGLLISSAFALPPSVPVPKKGRVVFGTVEAVKEFLWVCSSGPSFNRHCEPGVQLPLCFVPSPGQGGSPNHLFCLQRGTYVRAWTSDMTHENRKCSLAVSRTREENHSSSPEVGA